MYPILQPDIPYVGLIDGELNHGKMIRIQGSIPAMANRFNINLQYGPNIMPRDPIALHISVRLIERVIVRNSLQYQQWAREEDHGTMPVAPGQQFEILILCEPNEFKIAFNGEHYCEFNHRMPCSKISHLTIDGDVMISLISYESGIPQIVESAPAAPQQFYIPNNPNAPPYYLSPQSSDNTFRPAMFPTTDPNTYQSSPPPPPGYDRHGNKPSGGSDFGSFLNQAGTAIAGALTSGGILNALSNRQNNSSFMGTGGGFPFPNMGSGYPAHKTGSSGGFGSFLADTLTNTLFSNKSHK